MQIARTTVLCAVLLSVAALVCPTPGLTQQTPSSPLPGKQAVLTAIGQQRLLGDTRLKFDIKPWLPRPSSYVALLYLTTSSDSLESGSEAVRAPQLQPTLVLLQSANGQLTVVAQSNAPNALGQPCRALAVVLKDPALGSGYGDPDGTRCVDFHFDLAPYRITSTDTAIGVRTKIHSSYPAGDSDSEDLTLFAIDAHQLKPVFAEEMSGSYEERGPNEMDSSKATLRVDTQKTADHFNLILLQHNRTDKLIEDGDGGRNSKSLSRRTFTWNGSTYVERK